MNNMDLPLEILERIEKQVAAFRLHRTEVELRKYQEYLRLEDKKNKIASAPRTPNYYQRKMARNEEMYQKYFSSAASFRSLALEYGISTPRVQQIIADVDRWKLRHPDQPYSYSDRFKWAMPFEPDEMQFGDICRAKCTAPARYLKNGKCAFVSAMDNDLGIDDAIQATGGEDRLPLPSDDDLKKMMERV